MQISRNRQGPFWQKHSTLEPWRRVQYGFSAVGLVIALGCIGYRWLGLGWFDAFYQTIVTVTTVGYSEIEVDNANLRPYRVLSLFLMVFGVGSVLYTFGTFADNLIEGNLNTELRRRRMLKAVAQLDGHTIVAGWGQVGHSVASYVDRAGSEVVVIDRNPQISESAFPVVVGEATEDEVLLAAGITRAKTLAIALDHDTDTLFVCLSARALCPNLFIVARTNDQKNESKFYQAGASRVINPHEIGGSRMAALALHPHVAEFLDEVMHDKRYGVTVEEVEVPKGSPATGHSVVDLCQGDASRPLILAIKRRDGRYEANPDPHATITAGEVIIAMGSAEQLHNLWDVTKVS